MAVPYCSEGNTDRNAPSQHPISPPPPELVQLWWEEAIDLQKIPYTEHIAARAAQWGWDQRAPEIQAAADAELEACCARQFRIYGNRAADDLRAARRPKPPSLKQQGLEALEAHFAAIEAGEPAYRPAYKATIRRALEALPDD